MIDEWREKKLSDLGKIQTGTTPKTSQLDNFGNFIPFSTPADFCTDGSIKYNNKGLSEKGLKGSRLIDDGSVLMVCIGATIGKCGFNERDIAVNQQINALTPSPDISSKFLYYQMLTPSFQEAVLHNSGQATLPIINKTKWSNLTVSIPSFFEQKRIVAILDEAFAVISQAVANAEKNLSNARELFDSYLNNIFTQKGEDWVRLPLGEVLKLEYGKPLPREDRDENGAYPAYGANGIKCRTNKFYRNSRSMIVGRKGSAGEITLTEEKYWPLDVTYFVDFDSDQYDLMFLYYCLESLNLQSLAKGVKPGINRNDVYAIKFVFPKLNEQKRIVAKFDDLSNAVQSLEAIYQQKLLALTELKQSILQKAFTGELTSDTVLQQANG